MSIAKVEVKIEEVEAEIKQTCKQISGFVDKAKSPPTYLTNEKAQLRDEKAQLRNKEAELLKKAHFFAEQAKADDMQRAMEQSRTGIGELFATFYFYSPR